MIQEKVENTSKTFISMLKASWIMKSAKIHNYTLEDEIIKEKIVNLMDSIKVSI